MQSPQARRPKILVVDDNEANRLLVQDALQDEGYEVILCDGGEHAVALFALLEPDCVLLDVRMPGVDGITTCEQIRASPAGRTTPIIFLTALRDVDTFDRAIAAGADDFLTKPVQPSDLLGRVQTALKVRRMSVELHEQYDLLRGQRDELMRVHMQKERLMAFVVHDLKNPVNSMDLQAQVLLLDEGLAPASRTAAQHIRTEAALLGRMIANLLDLSKSDEGKLTPKFGPVDVRGAVERAVSDLAANAARHTVTLTTNVHAKTVCADQEMLRRILGNLIENAIRHAPASSVVSVSAHEQAGKVDLRVTDAGVGVPVESRESIFGAFVQVDGDHARASGGRGLGLAFCKLAVQAQQGSIWVEDAAPGAAFCVRLPVV